MELRNKKEILQQIEGKNDGVQRNQLDFPVVNSEWFIVSSKWLQKWKKSETLGEIDNSDIIDFKPQNLKLAQQVFLHSDICLHSNYEILPSKVWKLFQQQFGVIKGHTIKRYSQQISKGETQVEVRQKIVKIVIINKLGNLHYPHVKFMQISHQAKIGSAIEKLTRLLKQQKVSHIKNFILRLWKLDMDKDFQFIKQNTPMRNFKFPGTLLSAKKTFEQAEVADQDLVVAQMKQTNWNLLQERPQVLYKTRCQYCSKNNQCIKCPCGRFFYCDQKCMEIDSHNCVTKKLLSEYTSRSMRGLAGLQNLGNTCFMNSGLQCLSNTEFLMDYILSREYSLQINQENPLGTRGVLVQEFASLIRELWLGQRPVISPWGFKSALAQFARQFAGYHQHDSQEMLSFLIDGIHQDLNRIKQKPYSEQLKVEGKTDEEMAEVFWEDHLQRNSSVIVDNMHGQYRSQVVCPQCQYVSLAFDPFVMVSLPIPSVEKMSIGFLYVKKDIRDSVIQGKIQIPKNSDIGRIRSEIQGLLEIQRDVIVVDSVTGEVLNKQRLYQESLQLVLYQIPQLEEDECLVWISIYSGRVLQSGSITGLQNICLPRLLNIHSSILLCEIYQFLFQYFYKLQHSYISPQHLSQEFTAKFPKFHNIRGSNWFTARFENPSKNKKKSHFSIKNCPFCNQSNCGNCQIPYSEISLQSCISSLNGILKIQLIWSRTQIPNINSQTERHQSFYLSNMNSLNQELSVSLSDCLTLFSKQQQLDAQNTTYCPGCRSHVQGIKKIDLFKLPKTLIFHLKRFKQSGFYNSRNNKKVDFPITGLQMSQFCLTSTRIYDLYAVSNHMGNSGFGHYTAYAKNPQTGDWSLFNDSRVTPVQHTEQMVTEAAYVLFYKQRDH